MPYRVFGPLLIFLLLTGIVTAFAAIFIATGEISGADTSGVRYTLTGRIDALYYSAVTITTLGYGDYLPTGSFAKLAVVRQLASGVLILLFFVPVVVARLADWSDDAQPSAVPPVTPTDKDADGGSGD